MAKSDAIGLTSLPEQPRPAMTPPPSMLAHQPLRIPTPALLTFQHSPSDNFEGMEYGNGFNYIQWSPSPKGLNF